MYYTGIGNRDIPNGISTLIERIAIYLEECGYILRSGGAPGSDSAFEHAVSNKENKIIYLPWNGFNGRIGFIDFSDEVYLIAKEHHPYWDNLTASVQKLMMRNVYQILGEDLNTPSMFVVCYNSKENSGTAMALRVAKSYDVPIYNLALEQDRQQIEHILNS